MNNLIVELEKIQNEFDKRRKKLKQQQNNEGITKIVYKSCYTFNLGNELTNEEFQKVFS